MSEYTIDDLKNAFQREILPLVREVLRAKIKRATPTTEKPGEAELTRLNPPIVAPSLSKKAQDVKNLLDDMGKKQGPVPMMFYQAFGVILDEEIPRGEAPKSGEPWFGEVVHMVVEDDGQGGKETVYPPFTMLVPLSNPNRHVYPLGKPVLTHGGLKGITFQPGDKGEAGEIMDGNTLPSATLDPRCVRYATDEEIDAFLDKLLSTFEGGQMMLGLLNYFDKEDAQKAKQTEG